MATGGVSKVSATRGGDVTPPVTVRSAVIVGLAGITEMGPIGTPNIGAEQPITSFAEYKALYGGFTTNARELPLAVKAFFDEAGPNSGSKLFVSRIVHHTDATDPTTKTSAKGELALQTASFAPTAPKATGTTIGPFDFHLDLLPSISITTDAVAVSVAITADPATLTAADASPYTLNDGDTLEVTVNGDVQTITFDMTEFGDISNATTSEVIAVINAQIVGASASSDGGKPAITTDRRGTSATLAITGGTAVAAFGVWAGTSPGTGDVADISAVTVTELKTLIEANVAGVVVNNVGGCVEIERTATGSTRTVQVLASSSIDDELGIDNAIHTGLDGTPEDTVLLSGKWDGEYIHEFSVEVAEASNGDADRFNLILLRNDVPIEQWTNASLDPTDTNNYLIYLINNGTGGQKASKYITAEYVGTLDPPDNNPDLGSFGPFTGGDDGLVGLAEADWIGGGSAEDGLVGIHVFDALPRLDEVAAPGRTTAAWYNALVTYVDVYREGRAFGTLSGPAGYSVAQMRTHILSTANVKGTSESCRCVYPRIAVDNPAPSVYGIDDYIYAGAEGAVIGMHARITASKVAGAFEQAAGQENGYLRSARGIETTEAEVPAKRGLLQDDNVNVIRATPGVPIYVDGSDCLKSLAEGAVFGTTGESRGVILVLNDSVDYLDRLRMLNISNDLFSRISNALKTYLEEFTNAGAFRTRRPKEAFFVDVGPGQNTTATIDRGEVNVVLGLNTSPAAKYINVIATRSIGLARDFASRTA